MNFEPQKFFIGLIDFFSILMPGAVVAYLGKDWVASMVLGRPDLPLEETESVMIFLFMAYLLGHIAFLLGSLLDTPYDWFRKCTALGQSNRLAKGQRISYRFVRWLGFRALARWVFGGNADEALVPVVRIKSLALAPLSASKAINAFQWCKARLSKEHSDGLLAVQRFEADSKFFRSFAVVLIVLLLLPSHVAGSVLGQAKEGPFFTGVTTALLLLTLWRYVDQRFKSTQQAYWFAITLESMTEKILPLLRLPNRRKENQRMQAGSSFGSAMEPSSICWLSRMTVRLGCSRKATLNPGRECAKRPFARCMRKPDTGRV